MNLSYRQITLAGALFLLGIAIVVVAVRFAVTGLAGPGAMLFAGAGMCVAGGVSLLRSR